MLRAASCVTCLMLWTGAALADGALAAAFDSWRQRPAPETAIGVTAEVMRLSALPDWPAIAGLGANEVAAMLPLLPQDQAAELILLTAMAQGYGGDRVAQDAIAAAADEFARALPGPAARSLSVNLGYGYLQTGAPDRAFERLDQARQQIEAAGDAAALINICIMASDTFDRYGHTAEAGSFYAGCDASPLLRRARAPGTGIFHHNQAQFLAGQGEVEPAISRHRLALEYLDQEFGDPSVELANAYDALAMTLLHAGELGAADTTAGLAQTQAVQAAGTDHADYWRIANNAASIKRALRLPAHAYDLDAAALEWRRANLGEDAALSYASWLNLSLDLAGMGEWQAAGENFLALYARLAGGEPIPYSREVLEAYLHYIKARQDAEKGLPARLPPFNPLIRQGAPAELFTGMTDLAVDQLLARGETDEALRLADWLHGFLGREIGPHHPFTFEAALLAARAQAPRSAEAASAALAGLDIDAFNWTRRQALSGSYDAALAARVLGDDLLTEMARHAIATPAFSAQFGDAIHRWKTLEDPSDRILDRVARQADDPGLRQAARDYALAAARLRETARAEPVSEGLARQDEALRHQRAALNLRLAGAGLAQVMPPLAALDQSAPAGFTVAAGDVVIDLILLREWAGHDRSGTADTLALYAAVYRADTAPVIHLVSRMKDAPQRMAAFHAQLHRDLGPWLAAEAGAEKRLFIAPDAMLFQFDLPGLRDATGARLGESHDVYLLTDRGAYARHDTEPGLDRGDRILLAGAVQTSPDAPGYLPGALHEIETIAALTATAGAEVTRLTGTEATASHVASGAEGAAILHLATHGFFHAVSDHPASLMNAGLVLAAPADGSGASGATDGMGGADGIVHALELMEWNLGAARLVVLSACDTGVGATTPIDAVRGLPLALSRAGARRSLVTLGPVPDHQTARIMERFYTHLTTGRQSYADAFNATRRDIWAGRIEGVNPETGAYFVLYSH
ncbi:MAG: CHAT domain-containing protein [Paracoccus sp. (in: a-proteobacteria)]|nr:CHAT domain-containing protein [Paracoccus sp. (in: a-proteobacteria)]